MTTRVLCTLGKRYLNALVIACCGAAFSGHAVGVAAEANAPKKPGGFFYDPG